MPVAFSRMPGPGDALAASQVDLLDIIRRQAFVSLARKAACRAQRSAPMNQPKPSEQPETCPSLTPASPLEFGCSAVPLCPSDQIRSAKWQPFGSGRKRPSRSVPKKASGCRGHKLFCASGVQTGASTSRLPPSACAGQLIRGSLSMHIVILSD